MAHQSVDHTHTSKVSMADALVVHCKIESEVNVVAGIQVTYSTEVLKTRERSTTERRTFK